MSANLKEIAASGKKTVDNVSEIVAQVKQGQGTVGKLLSDQNLAADLDDTMSNARQSAINLNHASSHANETMADFQARDLLGRAEAVLENTRQADSAVESIRHHFFGQWASRRKCGRKPAAGRGQRMTEHVELSR